MICLSVCPSGAILSDARGRVTVATDRCDGCGVCVSACPTDAFDLPGSSLSEQEALLAELLRPMPESDAGMLPGIVFACSSDADLRGSSLEPAALPGGWSVVTVACVSMVTPGWILQTIARGARAVALLPCANPAALPQGISLLERVEFCQRLLAAAGLEDPERRVRLLPTGLAAAVENLRGGPSALVTTPPRTTVGTIDPPNRLSLREPEATVEALCRLAPVPAPATTVSGLASPLGHVRLDAAACTSCGACVLVCPTGALALDRDAQGSTLVIDASRCIPDGYCAAVCPEQALQMEPAVDFSAIGRGPTALVWNALVCRRCGAPCSEQAIVRLVRGLLPPPLGSFLDEAAELCAECAAEGLMEREVTAAPFRDVGAGPVTVTTARSFAARDRPESTPTPAVR